MNKEEIAKKYFLKGYKYAVSKLSIEPERDISVDFYSEELEKEDII